MYNIFFVLNSIYIDFGKILLGSIYENCDLSKINRIYISETGLKKVHLDYIKKKYDKVDFISSSTVTKFKKWRSHGEEWQRNISNKTKEYLKILKDGRCPLVMIDADCMVIKDLYDLIDLDYDIQLCSRRRRRSPYLASFFISNNINAVGFVEKWRSIYKCNCKVYRNQPMESPSLGFAYLSHGKKYKIKKHDLNEVAADPRSYIENEEYRGDTKIIHFKVTSRMVDGEVVPKTSDFNIMFNRRTYLFKNKIQKYL